MSDEIIIEEKEEVKHPKRFLQKIIESFKIKDIIKIDISVFLFTIILIIFTNNFIISLYLIIYGILTIFLINIINKILLIIIEKKTKFVDNLINFYETKLYYSEIKEVPYDFVKNTLKILISSLISNVLIIILFILFFDIIRYNLIILLIGILLLVYPYILLLWLFLSPILKERKINSDLDKELPFASMVLTIFSASNMNPYYALSYLAKKQIF